MSEKVLNTRIISKHDVESNWNKATRFIPKTGEIIIYDADENYAYERMKIGDGVNYIADLPFVLEAISNVEIDEICGNLGLDYSTELIDISTGVAYRLYVDNGDLAMTEVTSA